MSLVSDKIYTKINLCVKTYTYCYTEKTMTARFDALNILSPLNNDTVRTGSPKSLKMYVAKLNYLTWTLPPLLALHFNQSYSKVTKIHLEFFSMGNLTFFNFEFCQFL